MPNIKKNDVYQRSALVESSAIDEKERTVEVAFSSEAGVQRWLGVEILDHKPSSIRLGRLQDGGAVLMDHNQRDQIGVIESAWIDKDKVGRAVLRFGRSERADEVFRDVVDGIRKHISVGYRIYDYEETKTQDHYTYRVTDWEPYEISFVSVPADASVGVGRALDDEKTPEIERDLDDSQTNKGINMPKHFAKKPEDDVRSSGAPDVINADDVRAEERQRLVAIERSASQSRVDLSDLKREAIEKGWSAEQFRAQAFEKLASSQVQAPATRIADDMLAKSPNQDYSLVRAIEAQYSGDWSSAGFEREMSQELARSGGVIAGGLLIPAHILGRSVDTTAAGGLIANNLRPDLFIDALRANTVLGRAGATFLSGLNGKFSAPKKSTSASFGFNEEGEDAGVSGIGISNVEMSGKHISGVVPITFEMLRQSSHSIENIVRQDLFEGLALAIDWAALNGDGQDNNPLGILSTVGIHTVTASNATNKVPTWKEILALEGALDDANALKGKLAYLFRSTISSQLKGVPKDAGSGKFIIENGLCNDHLAISTTQLPANCSLFGNFADLWIGTWGAVELLPERKTRSGGLEIGVHQMVDVGVRHAQSFAKIV